MPNNLDACMTWRSFLAVSMTAVAVIFVCGVLWLVTYEVVRHLRNRR